MNKCDKCGCLHYRTDPCRVAKKSVSSGLGIASGHGSPKVESEARVGSGRSRPTKSTAARPVRIGNAGDEASREQVQALPVDTNSLHQSKASSGNADGGKPLTQTRPATFDKKAWMREYMRDHRRGIRRRNAKS